jgi:hypothetical protein
MRQQGMAVLAVIAMAAGLLLVDAPGAQASAKGRRNTAIGLGAATAYSLLRHKTTQGVILGAGTAYAYSRYRHARRAERRRSRVAGYRGCYQTASPQGWHHGRKRGWRGRSVPPGLYR